MITIDVVPGDRSGGATTSHTIVIPALRTLISAVAPTDDLGTIETAVVDQNILGKDTVGARKRTLRYLRELYVLRPDSVLYRALRDLWNDDASGQPLLACLCAMARDPVFRASAPALFDKHPGDEMTSTDFADAVENVFPHTYNASTLAKIGRNTASSWEQSGHLAAASRTVKVRRGAVCTASTVAFALLLGHLQGLIGETLFDTIWIRVLDRPRPQLVDLAAVASQRSLIDFRHSGGITEVRFRELLRPIEGRLL